MKNIIILTILLVIMYLPIFGQTKKGLLQVYSITEYIDGYVIKAVDTIKHDTLAIISKKEVIKRKRTFKKLVVGKDYIFEYEDLIRNMAAAPPNNFVARIKTTIVWKSGDGTSNIPVYSKNIKDIWIKK